MKKINTNLFANNNLNVKTDINFTDKVLKDQSSKGPEAMITGRRNPLKDPQIKNIRNPYNQLPNGLAVGASGPSFLKKRIKGIVGHPLNSSTLKHYASKEIVYSFNKANNLYPLLTKTEYLLKSLFLSMYSLISRPIYLIKHDKIVIRLFVFLSPKADKYLDTSSIVKGARLRGASPKIFRLSSYRRIRTSFSKIRQRIQKYLKYKSKRAKTIDILNSQIQQCVPFSSAFMLSLEALSISSTPLFPSLASASQATTQEEEAAYSSPKWDGVGYPEVREKRRGVTITYPYTSLVSNFKNKLEKLSVIFSKIFNKKVEFEIIKAQLPFQDPNILAQILGYNANNYKFRRMLKILIPRAVIKNPSKELTPPSLYPMLATFNLLNDKKKNKNLPWFGWGAKDLNIYFSQPSSYLPPFFYSKDYLNGIHSVLFTPSNLSHALPYSAGTDASVTLGQGGGSATPSTANLKGATGLGHQEASALVDKEMVAFAAPFAPNGPEAHVQGEKRTSPKSQTGKSFANLKERLGLAELLADMARITKGKSSNKKLVANQYLPSYLSGMNIRLAGRLMTQSMRPRFTVQSHQEGSLARVKVHYTEKSRFTGKNKRGAFSFTVTISHVLN